MTEFENQNNSNTSSDTSLQYFNQLAQTLLEISNALSAVVLRKSSGKQAEIMTVVSANPIIDARSLWIPEAIDFINQYSIIDNTISTPTTILNTTESSTDASHEIFAAPLHTSENKDLYFAIIKASSTPLANNETKSILNAAAEIIILTEQRKPLFNLTSALDKLKGATGILTEINSHIKFKPTSMSFCNALAATFKSQRVAFGIIKNKSIKAVAVNHTEEFNNKMQLMQDIELAMEECYDQNREIIHPAINEIDFISRFHKDLAQRHQSEQIISMPIRYTGHPVAVITLERDTNNPFKLDEIETIRLACELCGPKIYESHLKDLWFFQRWLLPKNTLKQALLGPQYTARKIGAIACLTVILFLFFGKGTYRVESPFALEATLQQVISAPFDGFLKEVHVEVSDKVKKETSLLATFDTAELVINLSAHKAELARHIAEYKNAARQNLTTQKIIAQTGIDEENAEIELLEFMIAQANIKSKIDGIIIIGDLKQQIGAPVKRGDTIFMVTPIESLRAELLVPEDQILDIALKQTGQLATVSYPSIKIPFIVERITPVAEIANQQNIFKVRVRIDTTYPWMRPGMEGVAKVDIDKRRYIWIWTRKLTNWLRMQFWV